MSIFMTTLSAFWSLCWVRIDCTVALADGYRESIDFWADLLREYTWRRIRARFSLLAMARWVTCAAA